MAAATADLSDSPEGGAASAAVAMEAVEAALPLVLPLL